MTTEAAEFDRPEDAEPAPRARRELPRWAGVLVIVAAMAGAAWVVYWYLTAASPRGYTVTFASPPMMAQGAADAVPAPWNGALQRLASPTGVRVVREGEWAAKSGQTTVRIVRQKDQSLQFNFAYSGNSVAAPGEMQRVRDRNELLRNRDLASSLGISPEQLANLRKVAISWAMQVSDADRERIVQLWNAYAAADGQARSDAETALLKELEEVGKRSLAPTQAAIARQAAAIEAVLTKGQWDRFRQRRG